MFFNIVIYRVCQDMLASTSQSDGDLFSFTSPSHFSETPLSLNLHPSLREFLVASEFIARRLSLRFVPRRNLLRGGSRFVPCRVGIKSEAVRN